MTDSEKEYQDQAHMLRDKMESAKVSHEQDNMGSNFPPRSEVHKDKTTKLKWRIRYPVVRLLALFFILLPITLLSIYYYNSGDMHKSVRTMEKAHHGYENIEIPTKMDSSIHENQESNSLNTDETTDVNQQQNEDTSKGINSNVVNDKDKRQEQASLGKKVENKNVITHKKSTTPQVQYEIKYHVVKANETLFSISMLYYHNKYGVQLIQNWNHLHSEDIYVGQTLKIPIKK